MYLSDVCIRRPVLATVISLLLVLFGAIGFRNLAVREYPAVDPPIVTVTTTYAGANPDIVDSQITEPLEQAINGIAGIRTISSTSREGQSQIRVEFTLSTDIEAAANDVRDKVAGAVRRLPADADPPSVEKADADSDPIIFLAITSDTRPILELSNLADTVVKERVQTIPGVSAVRIFGEKRYAMRLYMDPERMAAHGITPVDVERAVETQNVDLPAGRIEGSATELTLQASGRLGTPEDFEKMVLRESGGRQILFRDVGRAELSAENLRSGNKSVGIPMIGVAVIPQPNTNAIAIADEFYRRLAQIERDLPADCQIEIGFDFTRFVRSAVGEVKETIVIAFGLVALVIFLFLRDVRSTLVPVVAIPVSIISAFFIMYVAGFSINILTLVGIVLSIGLVCDDAIVVLENIYSKVERGLSPLEAALVGSREIYFAVISTTVTLAAVFLPILFLQGLTGRLFREFAVVVAGSVLVSALVALSLSPMMCRFLVGADATHGLLWRMTEPFFAGLAAGYRWLLRGWMRARLFLTLPLLGATVAVIVLTAMDLKSELAPQEDRSNIRLNVRAPEGSTYDFTANELDRLAIEIDDKYGDQIHRMFSVTGRGDGANSAFHNIYLKDPDQRSMTAFELLQRLSADLEQFTTLRAVPSMPPTIGDRRGGSPVQFVIQAPSFEQMQEVLPRFLAEAGQHPALRFVDSDLKVNRPQVKLEINRDRAAELGVSVRDIAQTLQFMLGDRRYGYFIKNGRQYQVIGSLGRPDRNDPEDLKRLYVRSRSGEMIALDSLVTMRESIAPAAIYRFNRFVSATISANPAPGRTLGEGIAAMEEVAARVLPEGFSTALAGQSRDFAESSSSLYFAFALALVLIYLVLAAQFESFIDPFIILLTVPLSLAGALLSLRWMGMSLNIFSQIGIIMLVGLVTKNGILIVEFANQRKEGGLSVLDAAMESATSRFRPILMTSISTMLGISPIAFTLGHATGSRQSLGVAVLGGMALATVLSLFVVPAVYAMLSREVAPAPEHNRGEMPGGAAGGLHPVPTA